MRSDGTSEVNHSINRLKPSTQIITATRLTETPPHLLPVHYIALYFAAQLTTRPTAQSLEPPPNSLEAVTMMSRLALYPKLHVPAQLCFFRRSHIKLRC